MSIRYNGKTYPTTQILLKSLGKEAGDQLPESAENQIDIFPDHDPVTQFVTWKINDNFDWELVVKNKQLFARLDANNHVVSLSDSDTDGIEIPSALVRHVSIGWVFNNGNFRPSSISSFQTQLRSATRANAELVRDQLSSPSGKMELANWLANMINISLYKAGAVTPMWDVALQIESKTRGISVDALRAKQIAKAELFYNLSALVQGLVGRAETAFSDDDFETLLANSSEMNAQALLAMKDPLKAITEALSE